MKMLTLVFLIPFSLFAQAPVNGFVKKQSGPYFGLQQGKEVVLEIGFEKRIKEIQFKKPHTHAFDLGANYDFKRSVLGADLGYWYRPNRIGFTFGGVVSLRSDFNRGVVGFSPTIGYKIWLLHANVGYYFYPNSLVSTNTLFLNLRLVLSDKTSFKRK